MSVRRGSFFICFDVCKYRTCECAVQRVSGRLHTEGAEVRIKGSTCEICVKVVLNESLYEKSLPFTIVHSSINHSIIAQPHVTREWTMCPIQAAHPRQILSPQEQYKEN